MPGSFQKSVMGWYSLLATQVLYLAENEISYFYFGYDLATSADTDESEGYSAGSTTFNVESEWD